MTLENMIQSLIDDVNFATIVGPEGSSWAETPGFAPIPSELDSLLDAFDLRPLELQRGLQFMKENFMVVHQEKDLIIAQNQSGIIVLAKCSCCTIVSYAETENDGAVNCLNATKRLKELIDKTPLEELC